MQRFFTSDLDQEFLDVLIAEGVTVTAYDRITFIDEYYDDETNEWVAVERPWDGSSSSEGAITMVRRPDPGSNAALLFHEGFHQLQPAEMAEIDAELQAHVAEERWRQDHGLPPFRENFRIIQPDGQVSIDEDAVREFVEQEYPPGNVVEAPDGTTQRIIGYDERGWTIVELEDGTTMVRKPQRGDRLPGTQENEPPDGIPVNLSLLRGR